MITRENYEAVYLDYLEGNCSPELTSELLLFLEAHPDLKLDDELLPVLESEQFGLSEFDKLLLKKSEEKAIVITPQNVDYYFVAQTERQLTLAEEQALATWLKANPAFVAEQALHQQSILQADQTLVYPNKKALKKEAAIIPLWTRSLSIAASLTLLIGLGWWASNSGADPISKPGIVNGQTANNDPKPVKPFNPSNDSVMDQNKPVEEATPKHEAAGNRHQVIKPLKNQTVLPDPLELKSPMEMAHEEPKAPSDRGTNGIILPEQPIEPQLATVLEPSTPQVVDKSFAWNNPIAPITNSLSAKLNTPIDFRKQKPTSQEAGGFYLKIGKFELSHKRGGRK